MNDDELLEKKIEKSKHALLLASKMSLDYYDEPLIVSYSGGKDSDVLVHLARTCLDPSSFEVMCSHTSVEAPQTVYHIKEIFKDLNDNGIKTILHIPRYADGKQITMWNLVPNKLMPPTRIHRYCCEVLKESSTPYRICALGVRESESVNRSGRDTFSVKGMVKREAIYYSLDHAEEVYTKNKITPQYECAMIKTLKSNKEVLVNPIYEWTDDDIWNYINKYNLKVNPLYYPPYNFPRVGCVGCPMGGGVNQMQEFTLFPKYKLMWMNAFDRLLKERERRGLDISIKWKDAETMFYWWTESIKYFDLRIKQYDAEEIGTDRRE